jgi:hypothetical protein
MNRDTTTAQAISFEGYYNTKLSSIAVSPSSELRTASVFVVTNDIKLKISSHNLNKFMLFESC